MLKKVNFPNLDGWRFVAFLAVFFYHSFSTQLSAIKDDPTYIFVKSLTKNGDLGVDFFFVLSGFLIIYLLIDERKLTGKINAKNFYIRRILRIFPLYFFCVFFGFVLFPVIKSLLGAIPEENANLQYYLLFLSNIDIYNQRLLPDSGVLGILWSVGVEEQFYLTIPLVLLLVPVRYYKWVFAFVILSSWVIRAVYMDEYFLKFHTFAVMGNLAIGGLVAYYSALNKGFVTFFENLNPWLIRLTYVSVISIFFFRSEIFPYPILKVFDTSIIAFLFAIMLLEQNYSKRSDFKMQNNKVFSRLGKYTYGLYCLHILAALIILQITSRLGINGNLWQVLFIETPLILIASFILAYLSFHFYERPFLRLKDKFSSFRETKLDNI